LQQRKTFANERKLERTKLVRDEGEFCKPLMLGNNKNVPREKNGLILVPEASVKPVVRAIKIMIGRKVLSGAKKKD
jgi:hypothetical protein